MMKIRKPFLVLPLACPLLLAHAELPFSAQALATAQAMIDECSRTYPADAARYQDRARMIVKGLPDAELAAMRESDDFKTMYEAVRAGFAAQDAADAEKACNGLLNDKE